MRQIELNPGTELSYDEFEKRLLGICKQHKDQKRALAFAFIVYDFTDPSLRKVLKDKVYRDALNDVSGKYLTIFYIHSRSTSTAHPCTYNQKPIVHMLTSLDINKMPVSQGNVHIKKGLGISEDLQPPFIIFFQSDGEKILDSFAIPLKANKIEESFNELNSHIKTAIDSIANVSRDNYQNNAEIFELIKSVYSNKKIERFIKISIKLLLGFIKTQLGLK